MDAESLTFRPTVGDSIIIVMDGVDVQARVISVDENAPGKGFAICHTAAPVDVTVAWSEK